MQKTHPRESNSGLALPSFKRQRNLLALLDSLGGRAGNLDFQKLLFLYCQQPGDAALYEFVPYKFGAFSFTSYADRRKLIETGLLAENDTHWELTSGAKDAIRRDRDLIRPDLSHKQWSLRGDALVAETYRRFPYYAIRSEIANRVLKGNQMALRNIEAARPKAKKSGISTIGYEGRTLESYLNQLIASGVTVLCDVRKNPISRKYGFSKKTLGKGCEGVGIRYEHLPELGIESDQRQNLDSDADYEVLFATYEKKSLPLQDKSIKLIQSWISAGERVALTCYERMPHHCHRHCVSEAIERGLKVTAQHL